MPASVPVAYDSNDAHDSYPALLEQGRLLEHLAGVPCPRCPPVREGRLSDLVLTRSTVTRPVKLLRPDEYDVLVIVDVLMDVALARCRRCGGRFRVLPCDVLARKQYGFGVVERVVREYGKGDRGLRPVVWELHGEGPAHTTLHAWTEGLGAYAQGRVAGEVVEALPASRVVAEAESRYSSLEAVRRELVRVNPARYRSEGRRERLAGCARVMSLAAALIACAGQTTTRVASNLVEWSRLILCWCRSSPIGFRTGRRCTPFEHLVARPARSSCSTEKQEHACRIRTRSPFGATSRLPP